MQTKYIFTAWRDWLMADSVDRRYWRLRRRLLKAQQDMDDFDAWCARTGTEVRAFDPRLIARCFSSDVKALW